MLLHATGDDDQRLRALVAPMVPDAAVLCPLGGALSASGERSFYARPLDEPPLLATVAEAAGAVADLLAVATAQHGLDRRRVVLVAQSSGANVALGLVWGRPGLARAYALLRPTLADVPDADADLSGVEALLLLGDRDDLTTPERSAAVEGALTRSGASVTTHRDINAGHALSASDVLHLVAWLRRVTARQKRDD